MKVIDLFENDDNDVYIITAPMYCAVDFEKSNIFYNTIADGFGCVKLYARLKIKLISRDDNLVRFKYDPGDKELYGEFTCKPSLFDRNTKPKKDADRDFLDGLTEAVKPATAAPDAEVARATQMKRILRNALAKHGFPARTNVEIDELKGICDAIQYEKKPDKAGLYKIDLFVADRDYDGDMDLSELHDDPEIARSLRDKMAALKGENDTAYIHARKKVFTDAFNEVVAKMKPTLVAATMKSGPQFAINKNYMPVADFNISDVDWAPKEVRFSFKFGHEKGWSAHDEAAKIRTAIMQDPALKDLRFQISEFTAGDSSTMIGVYLKDNAKRALVKANMDHFKPILDAKAAEKKVMYQKWARDEKRERAKMKPAELKRTPITYTPDLLKSAVDSVYKDPHYSVPSYEIVALYMKQKGKALKAAVEAAIQSTPTPAEVTTRFYMKPRTDDYTGGVIDIFVKKKKGA